MKYLRKYMANKMRARLFFFILCGVLFFLLVYNLNRINPLYWDDYIYSYIIEAPMYEEQHQPVQSISDIFISQYQHYFVWGGRSVVHFIAQLLLLLGGGYAHLLNSVAYMLFIFLIYKYANIGRKLSPSLFLFINLLVFLVQYTFHSNCVWIVGSANYLWGTLIIIAFVYPYYSYHITRRTRESLLVTCTAFLFGVIAGWTNENTSVAMLFILAVLLIYLRFNKIHIPKWCIWGFLGACIGCAFMLAAPGNFARLEYLLAMNRRFGVDSSLSLQVGRMVWRYVTFMLLPVLGYWAMYRFGYKEQHAGGLAEKKMRFSLLLFFAAHVSFLAMLAAVPSFPQRATFGALAFMLISLSIVYVNTIQIGSYKYINKNLVLSLAALFFVVAYVQRYRSISYFGNCMNERIEYLLEQKQQGNLDIEFKPMEKSSLPYLCIEFISEDPEASINKEFAHYYGVNTVKLGDSFTCKN
jgi:hypothetical protein